MGQILHGSATTTAAVRRAIQDGQPRFWIRQGGFMVRISHNVDRPSCHSPPPPYTAVLQILPKPLKIGSVSV